jgi:hypothetical protein
MAAIKNLLWPVKSTIRIRFLDGPAPLNASVKVIAEE